MSEAMDGGNDLAWRLLATLEGGSFLLAISALLAYTVKAKFIKKTRQRIINSVLVTDVTTPLGQIIRQRLEARGCMVYTRASSGATSGATSGTTNGAISETNSGVTSQSTIGKSIEQVDAIVVIGAERTNGLDGMSHLVTEDVYCNLNVLESLSPFVKRGGCIAWACSGASNDAFHLSNVAYDAILRSSLQHLAKLSHCEAVWVGRCETVEQTADKILSAFYPCTVSTSISSFRKAVEKISEYLDNWWKTVT